MYTTARHFPCPHLACSNHTCYLLPLPGRWKKEEPCISHALHHNHYYTCVACILVVWEADISKKELISILRERALDSQIDKDKVLWQTWTPV